MALICSVHYSGYRFKPIQYTSQGTCLNLYSTLLRVHIYMYIVHYSEYSLSVYSKLLRALYLYRTLFRVQIYTYTVHYSEYRTTPLHRYTTQRKELNIYSTLLRVQVYTYTVHYTVYDLSLYTIQYTTPSTGLHLYSTLHSIRFKPIHYTVHYSENRFKPLQ